MLTPITDGVLMAFIPLLEVLPDHRGRGIGGMLLEHLVTFTAYKSLIVILSLNALNGDRMLKHMNNL